MWGAAPHRIDVHTRDGQETRRNNYNTSKPQYNYVKANIIVIYCTNSLERSHNNQKTSRTLSSTIAVPHRESQAAQLVYHLVSSGVSRVCRTAWFSGHPSLVSNTAALGVCGEGDCSVTVGPRSHRNSHQCGSSR